MKIVSALNSVADELVATEKQENRAEHYKAVREILTIFLVFATVVAAGVGDVFFYGQLREMQSSGADTQKLIEANGKLAEAAAKQASAAQTQADALVDTAKVSHQNMILAERAWVGPNTASFSADPVVGKPLDILISYLNTGRQPALQFLYSADIFPGTATEDINGTVAQRTNQYLEACKNKTEWSGGSVVYPTIGFSSYSLNASTKADFVDGDILNGNKLIFVQGCFSYRTFETPHHSYFCYFYKHGVSKIQNLSICANGHYAD